jgi:basic membrane lipoprotein Med (substrate-binding protein (PBP1-ABC) superfamily)
MKTKLILFLALAGLGLALAGCALLPAAPTASPQPPASSPTKATPAATTARTAALPATVTLPPPSPTVTPVPPTATPLPLTATSAPRTELPAPPTAAPTRLVLLASQGAPAAALFETIQTKAKEIGWQAEWKQDPAQPDLRAAAQDGAAIVIVADRALEDGAGAVAAQFPKSYFICLHLGDSGSVPNLLALGGATREDQAAFVAGMAAGYVTQARRVAVIGDPQSAEGRKYRNGFLHGVRYTCPKCKVDNLDVLNLTDTANVVDLAARYKLYGVDVFFAAAGQAGDAALLKVAQAGAWVIGSGSDIYMTQFAGGATAGADHVLTSVYLNPALAILNALDAYHAGSPQAGVQPLSAANLAVMLAPYRDKTGVLTPLDQQDIADALTRLGQGSLDTGIDPVTGEER